MIPAQVNEIPAHFIHEIKTKGYDVIGVDVFLRKLMRFLRKKEVNFIPPILLTQHGVAIKNYIKIWLKHFSECRGRDGGLGGIFAN